MRAVAAPFLPSRRRAVALLLAMIAVIVSTVVAYSYLGTQQTAIGIARNIKYSAQARAVAESGLDMALAFTRKNSTWRTTRPNGLWITDQAVPGGKYTVTVEDGSDTNGDGVITTPGEGDGNLSDDPSQKFTVTVTGKVEAANAVGQITVGGTCIRRAVVTPVNKDMVLYYKLDESAGTSASDSTGNGHIGTLRNMNVPSDWVVGKLNGGLRFKGGTYHVTTPDANDLDLSTAGTVSVWIKTVAYTSFGGIVHKGSLTSFTDETYSLQFWSGNVLYWGVTATNGAQINVLSPSAPALNTWVHVAGTFDPSNLKLYVNGTLVASRAGVTVLKSTGALQVGAQLNGSSPYSYNGIIDDVRIYNRVLSAAEVASLATGAAPSSSGQYLVDLVQ